MPAIDRSLSDGRSWFPQHRPAEITFLNSSSQWLFGGRCTLISKATLLDLLDMAATMSVFFSHPPAQNPTSSPIETCRLPQPSSNEIRPLRRANGTLTCSRLGGWASRVCKDPGARLGTHPGRRA